MAEDAQNFGYEQTLIYGQYSRELGSFAKFHAKRQKQKKDFGKIDVKPRSKLRVYYERCTRFRDYVFHKIGEDWIFLALLGVVMALLSFTLDFIIEKCQAAKFWLFEELSFSLGLQYIAWISYTLLFLCFSVGFTHLVAPQAIGSGIPEMKTILRGVVLKEFLTFRTFISKVVGLCSSLGSTLPLGKEGPFVHIASIVATLLAKLTTFKGIYENESRRSEMLAAACAVGVAGTFAAPIGGVLFSIEVTATYFAVRNYWRGFFAAVCGALMFRLLSIWFKHEETITALFKTNLRTEFPFDALELLAFAFIGVVCGFGGSLYILLHRKIILFTRKQKRMTAFLQKNRFIYPGLVALVISSITFPPGLGQFFAGELTARKAINELFSNITWTLGQADNLADEEVISHWKHPATNIYINLVIFTVMNFWMGALCNTLPVPAGVFVPVFTVGAGFGRLIGESMAAWFPEGITSENGVYKIVPGGYAVVGAASMSGAVTRTISTAVIVFELTGQISHVLPAVVSVLIANAVANQLQPSFYDSIIRLKKLPYLPDIVSSKSSTWKIFVEDIMVSDVKMIAFDSTYGDLKDLLTSTFHKTYPLVDTIDSRVLLGSIQRFELERLLLVNISHEQKITLPESPEYERSGRSSPASFVTASRSSTPPIKEEEDSEIPNKPISRFNVSKVEESEPVKPKPVRLSLPKPPSMPTLDIDEETKEKQTYHTLQLPPRSILKNSTPQGRLEKKSHSETDLKKDINTFYRKLTDTRKESIVEDVPFYIDKGSFSNLAKKVKLPPEPVKIKNLPSEKQQEWEAQKLMEDIDWEGCQIDPAPFQLVERTSLHKVHSLFSLLGLSHAYVTSAGKLIGVCGLKDLRLAIQGRIDEQGKSEPDKEETEDIDPANLEIETPPFNPEFVLTEVPDTDDEEEKDQIEMNSVKVTKA